MVRESLRAIAMSMGWTYKKGRGKRTLRMMERTKGLRRRIERMLDHSFQPAIVPPPRERRKRWI